MQENPNITEKASEILILSSLRIKLYRGFKPSEIAAASMLIATAIFKFGKKALLTSAISDDELKLFKEIWNEKVTECSHFDLDSILKPIAKMKKVIMSFSQKEDITYLWK